MRKVAKLASTPDTCSSVAMIYPQTRQTVSHVTNLAVKTLPTN